MCSKISFFFLKKNIVIQVQLSAFTPPALLQDFLMMGRMTKQA